MSSLIKQQGFPLLKVTEKSSPESNKRVFSLSQSTFLADGSTDHDDKLWSIPISVSTSESPQKSIKNIIMNTKTKDIDLEGVPKTSWIKLNSGTIGVYRTMYDSDLLEKIIPAIHNQTLPALDRLGLIDDLFATSQAGHASLDQVFILLKAYQNESNFSVWDSIINSLNRIGQIISHLEVYSKYKTFGQSLLKNIYNSLGWNKKENECHSNSLLRSLILETMVSFENELTIKEALYRFENHISGKEVLPVDLRSSVYEAVMMVGDASTLKTMLKLYFSADLNEEQKRILASLGSSKDELLLKEVLNFSLTKEVKALDALTIIVSVATRSYKGRLLAWKFFKDNYKTYMDLFKSGFLITRLISSISEHFVTEQDAEKIEEFFKTHPTPGAERNIQQSIETVRLNAAWLKRNENVIESFLSNV